MASKHRRSDWTEYVGHYTVTRGGGRIKATVYVQGGYLYMRYNVFGAARGLRLVEFQPGHFLTADCRPVRFQNGCMQFGDIAAIAADQR